jgi:hypothetical protein
MVSTVKTARAPAASHVARLMRMSAEIGQFRLRVGEVQQLVDAAAQEHEDQQEPRDERGDP